MLGLVDGENIAPAHPPLQGGGGSACADGGGLKTPCKAAPAPSPRQAGYFPLAGEDAMPHDRGARGKTSPRHVADRGKMCETSPRHVADRGFTVH